MILAMECIIWLKNGGVKYFTLPENSESYKLLKQANDILGENLTYADGKQYICYTLKAIMNAPKYTKFRYDYTEKRYTRKQAINYILDYDHRRFLDNNKL